MKIRLQEALLYGKQELQKENKDPREARLLLAFVMQVRKEELIKHSFLEESSFKQYQKIIKERALGVPFAYLVGHKEFMKLNFKVTPDVLIPRDDTEVLVEEVLQRVEKMQAEEEERKTPFDILDVCTGSGCIAISLAHYLPNCRVMASDISKEALKVAKENAQNLQISNVEFVHSNLFESLPKDRKWDGIVSNPPYICTNELDMLQDEVKKEPRLALDGGTSGTLFYECIAKEAFLRLNEGGFLAFEIGFDQAQTVKEIFVKNHFDKVILKQDLGGRDRVMIGIKESRMESNKEK